MRSLNKKRCAFSVVDRQKIVNLSLESIIDTTLVSCSKLKEKIPLSVNRSGERMRYVVHASQIGHCPLQTFFGVIEAPVEEVKDPRMLRIFDNGHAVHQRIQGYFIKAVEMGVGGLTSFRENEHIWIDELKIVGELDIMIQFFPIWVIVEIKSMKDDYFKAIKVPEEKWYNQLHCYMKATQSVNGISYVECKNTQNVKTFQVPWNDSRWEALSAKVKEINEGISSGKLPSYNKEDCYFCNYRYKYCPAYNKSPPMKEIQQLIEVSRVLRRKKGID